MSLNFKTIKKPAIENKMKDFKPDAFVVGVVPCTFQGGKSTGSATGNFEIVIKTPKGQGDNEMKAELSTVCLENRPSNFHPEWGGSHFRIVTFKQYELIIETLRSLSYGDKLQCLEVPNAFKSKAAPVLKLHHDAPNEWFTLSEAAFQLKYFLGIIGFKWRELEVHTAAAAPQPSLGVREEPRAHNTAGMLGSHRAHSLPNCSQAHARWRPLHPRPPSAEIPGRMDAQGDGHGEQLDRGHEGQPHQPLRHVRLDFCGHHYARRPSHLYPIDLGLSLDCDRLNEKAAYPLYTRLWMDVRSVGDVFL